MEMCMIQPDAPKIDTHTTSSLPAKEAAKKSSVKETQITAIGLSAIEQDAQRLERETLFGGSLFKDRIKEYRQSHSTLQSIALFISRFIPGLTTSAELAERQRILAEKELEKNPDRMAAIKTAKTFLFQEDQWRFTLEEAREQLSRGNFQEALSLLNNIEKEHSSEAFHFMKGYAQERLGHTQEAFKSYKLAEKKADWLSPIELQSKISIGRILNPVLAKEKRKEQLSEVEKEILLQERPNDSELIHSLLEGYLAKNTKEGLDQWYALATEKQNVLNAADKFRFGESKALGYIESDDTEHRLSFKSDAGNYFMKHLGSFDADQTYGVYLSLTDLQTKYDRTLPSDLIRSDFPPDLLLDTEAAQWRESLEKPLDYPKMLQDRAEVALKNADDKGSAYARNVITEQQNAKSDIPEDWMG